MSDVIDNYFDLIKKNSGNVITNDSPCIALFGEVINNRGTFKYPEFNELKMKLINSGVAENTKNYLSACINDYINIRGGYTSPHSPGLYQIHNNSVKAIKMFNKTETPVVGNDNFVNLSIEHKQQPVTVKGTLSSDTSRWLDNNIRDDTVGSLSSSNFVNNLFPRNHITSYPFDAIGDSQLDTNKNYGVPYNELTLPDYKIPNVNKLISNQYFTMLMAYIFINPITGQLSGVNDFSLDAAHVRVRVECPLKGNKISDILKVLKLCFTIPPNCGGNMNILNLGTNNFYTGNYIQSPNNHNEYKCLSQVETFTVEVTITTTDWSSEIITNYINFVKNYKWSLVYILLGFKRVGDRIPLIFSVVRGELLDTEDLMARIYHFWFGQYLRILNGPHTVTILKNINHHGDIMWREKYIKYKNKYLELKKKLLNQTR